MPAPGESLPPIHKTVTVPWPQSRAFTRFTAGLGDWWPYRSHSVGQANAISGSGSLLPGPAESALP